MAIKKGFRLARTKEGQVDIEETLFSQRHIFLTDIITDDLADWVIKEILVMDMVSKEPIQMYINSPGGSVSAGFAIIDIMQKIQSPIITIASGQVASMGTMIAMAGKERKCFSNSIFMLHDMFSGSSDYVNKMKDRIKFLDHYQDKLKLHIKKFTKLQDEETAKAFDGELWLFAEEALEKGLVDKII